MKLTILGWVIAALLAGIVAELYLLHRDLQAGSGFDCGEEYNPCAVKVQT